jgi:chemotaxis protein MotB
MKSLLAIVLVLAAVLGALFALVYEPQRTALDAAQTDLEACEAEAAETASRLQTRVGEVEGMLDELRQTSAELAAQIQEKEAELSRFRATHDQLVGELRSEIEDGQVAIEQLQGKLRVDVVDEILFDSGEATLKPAGKLLLGKVAGILAKGDRLIEVQGHTDNVPIVGRLAERFATNWELSAARAVGVVRFLQEEAELEPTRLSAVGLSEYRPRVSNDTDEGRQKNRRIEILLVPPPPSTEAADDQGSGA